MEQAKNRTKKRHKKRNEQKTGKKTNKWNRQQNERFAGTEGVWPVRWHTPATNHRVQHEERQLTEEARGDQDLCLEGSQQHCISAWRPICACSTKAPDCKLPSCLVLLQQYGQCQWYHHHSLLSVCVSACVSVLRLSATLQQCLAHKQHLFHQEHQVGAWSPSVLLLAASIWS